MYEDELHEFYSIPLVVPVPKYNYEIYIYRTQSWWGIYQLDGDSNLHKKKVSKFNSNWKIFDDANIADKFTNWTSVFGKHSEYKEEDFNEYKKAHLSTYNKISMWKFKSKKLIEKAKEFYADHHSNQRGHFGEFGIQQWYFDNYANQEKGNDQDEFDYMFDDGTKSTDIIKPTYLDRFNQPLSWHTHALQDVNYFNQEVQIRYKKI